MQRSLRRSWCPPACPIVAPLGIDRVSTLTIEVTDEELRFHFTFDLFEREMPLASIAKCVEAERSFLHGWGIHFESRLANTLLSDRFGRA